MLLCGATVCCVLLLQSSHKLTVLVHTQTEIHISYCINFFLITSWCGKCLQFSGLTLPYQTVLVSGFVAVKPYEVMVAV